MCVGCSGSAEERREAWEPLAHSLAGVKVGLQYGLRVTGQFSASSVDGGGSFLLSAEKFVLPRGSPSMKTSCDGAQDHHVEKP